MKQALMLETENKRNKNYLVHTEMIKHMISATIWETTFCTVLDSKIKIRKIMVLMKVNIWQEVFAKATFSLWEQSLLLL